MFHKKILLIEPCQRCWPKGYIVHQGKKTSINKTTIHTLENNIKPNQKRLEESFKNLCNTFESFGCQLEIIPFPDDLNDIDGISHSVLYVRDVGFSFNDLWIKSNFSAKNRQEEADVIANIMSSKYGKKVIEMPTYAEIEFGEVHYIETDNKTYYFGGISRANRRGQEQVIDIIHPDKYFIIESLGFHLDTVFTPVVDKSNRFVAIIVAKGMITEDSYHNLESLRDDGVKIINIDNKDTCDTDGLGTYAVNCFVGKGFLISGAKFSTPNVINELKSLDINFVSVDIPDYKYGGGSIHCITNELYI